MVKLRLKRLGSKKAPTYRIVAADSRSPRDGRIIDTVGLYNPTTNPVTVRLDEEKALKWLKDGAQPTDIGPGLSNGRWAWKDKNSKNGQY